MSPTDTFSCNVINLHTSPSGVLLLLLLTILLFLGVTNDSEQQCLRGLHLQSHHHTPIFCLRCQTVLLLLFATTLLLLQVLPRTMSGSGPAVNEDYICPTLPPSEVSEEWDGDPSSEEKGVW